MKDAFLIQAVLAVMALMPVRAELPVNWRQSKLIPDQTEFNWSGWHIKVNDLSFSDKGAESDSILVVLSMSVTNTSTKGNSFIPQNTIKLAITSNEFDAEDIDNGLDYLKYIEPTITRGRKCYFEVPRTQINDSFVLKFQEWFQSDFNLAVVVNTPEPTPTPTPPPVAVETPEPTQPPTPVAVTSNAPSVANTPSATEEDPYTRLNRLEQNLSNAWLALSPGKRNQIREEERRWITYKDALPIDRKIRAVEERCSYLQSFQTGEPATHYYQRLTGTEDDNGLSDHTKNAVEQFVVEYIKATTTDDTAKRSDFFAPSVKRFYEHGAYSRKQIQDSDNEYCKKWPYRSYQPVEGSFVITEDNGTDEVSVTEDFRWSVANRNRSLHGTSRLFLTIQFSEDGTMHIVDIDEQRVK